MLGPAADQPLGSFERAECFGNELDRVTEQVADAVARLAEVVKRILAEEEQILNAFGTPSLDEYLARCCGVGEMEMRPCCTRPATTTYATEMPLT